MKKIRNQEKLKKHIYSVSALALCVATLFSFWAANRDNRSPENDSKPTETTVTTTNEDVKANTPVTDVRDQRYSTTTEAAPKAVYYSFPLGDKISREFSKDELVKNNTTNDWRTHNGVDIAGNVGDPVKAICDGEVIEVSADSLWGMVVTINHNNGIIAKYCGLEKEEALKPGANVKINEKIGTLGEIPIEKADGVHLHLEIFKDGNLVSPSDYLGKTVDI